MSSQPKKRLNVKLVTPICWKTPQMYDLTLSAYILLLQLFVDFGTVYQVRQLLDKWRYSSDVVNFTWSHGDTILIEAGTIRGRDQMANPLIEFGANLNHANSKGWTMLHCAALYDRLTVVELLLQSGANVELWTHEENVMLLDLAQKRKHKEIEKLLLHKSPGKEGRVSGANWGVRYKQLESRTGNTKDESRLAEREKDWFCSRGN
jgi:ankyrin repeat protein